MPDPKKVFLGYLELLSPGGMFVLQLPRFSALNRLVSKAESPNVIPPYHLSLFDNSSLKIMLDSLNGYEIVEWWEDAEPAFNLVHLVETYKNYDVEVPYKIQDAAKVLLSDPIKKEDSDVLAKLGSANADLKGKLFEIDGGLFVNVFIQKISD